MSTNSATYYGKPDWYSTTTGSDWQVGSITLPTTTTYTYTGITTVPLYGIPVIEDPYMPDGQIAVITKDAYKKLGEELDKALFGGALKEAVKPQDLPEREPEKQEFERGFAFAD